MDSKWYMETNFHFIVEKEEFSEREKPVDNQNMNKKLMLSAFTLYLSILAIFWLKNQLFQNHFLHS